MDFNRSREKFWSSSKRICIWQFLCGRWSHLVSHFERSYRPHPEYSVDAGHCKFTCIKIESNFLPLMNAISPQNHAENLKNLDLQQTTVYLKLVDQNENMNVHLVFAQAKLAPKKPIPRLELCAAVLATKAVWWIVRELKLGITRLNYYTDSKITRANNSLLFQPITMERRDYSNESSDMITWGTTGHLITTSTWLNGPQFLRNDNTQDDYPLPEDDPEIHSFMTILTSNKSFYFLSGRMTEP